jgi:hypothetical protein
MEKIVSEDNIKQALNSAVKALYFGDNSDYETALWEIVSELGGQDAVDFLENDAQAAFNKYAC